MSNRNDIRRGDRGDRDDRDDRDDGFDDGFDAVRQDGPEGAADDARTDSVVAIVAVTATALIGALVATVLWTPVPAHAGRIAAERPPVVDRHPPAAPGYQVRCWQYGRLLFEERGVEIGDAPVQGLKLSGLDHRRLPVMVTDTGNATCLIRRTPPSRPGRTD